MTELANAMSFEMWAGYSARGGQTINPYGTGKDICLLADLVQDLR